MTSPLHAPFCADHALSQQVAIVENVRLARDTYRARFESPTMAERIVPGQFLMLRLAGCDDPLLGRAFALYDTVLGQSGERSGIDVVYLVTGKMTGRLVHCAAGQMLGVWGPLGNGFVLPPCEHLVMVAGGIGQTPFMALAREFLGLRSYGSPPRTIAAKQTSRRVTLCYGARTNDYLAGVEDFRSLGVDVRLSTDDGSAGHRGLVTEVLESLLNECSHCHVVCCGPEPMMAAVARIAENRQVTCQVSLETPMACGLGICFSCVAPVRDLVGGWDYRRTCVEGPVFDARAIAWDAH